MEKLLFVDPDKQLADTIASWMTKRPVLYEHLEHFEQLRTYMHKDAHVAIVVVPSLIGKQSSFETLQLFLAKHKQCIPVVSLSADSTATMIKAVNDFNARYLLITPFTEEDFFDMLDRCMANYQQLVMQQRLSNSVTSRVKDLSSQNLSLRSSIKDNRQAMLDSMLGILKMRDTETPSHSKRVAAYAMLLGKEAGLPKSRLNNLEVGSILHDIGKVRIPDAVLFKPGKLTPQEWEEMKQHPIYGLQIVEGNEFLQDAAEIIIQHHERFDGTGYPNGLMGEEISLNARIFSIVDTFDAITSDRAYHQKRSFGEAIQEIVNCRGTQFDPKLVDVFLKIPRPQWEVIRKRYEDTPEELAIIGVQNYVPTSGFSDS